MKIRNDHFKNTTDFKGRTGSATVNMDKLALQIGNMISNYNYPELAVLREWVSNAHDAHVAAGVKRPVKVTLPSTLNPTLTVQDFGLGMTTDFVENVYLSFGSSSKDESDDEIGGFGQGGKSALAIASQYTMTTISEGLKSIYIFERSPLGGMDFKLVIEEVPTEEPSGVTVQVAVDRFQEYSDTNLNRVLAGWSNADIELNTKKKFFSIPDNSEEVSYTVDLTDYTKQGEEGFEEDIRSEKGYVLNGAFDLTGGSAKLTSELGLDWSDYVVLVGPVAYIFKPEIQTNRVLKDYMVASVSIGDVTFPSSREVIEGSRTNRQIIGKCFEGIVDEADKLLQKRANSIADRKSALALHRSPLVKNRKDFQITYKDEVIPTAFTPAAGDVIFEYEHIGNYRSIKNYRLAEKTFSADSKLMLNIETLIVLDDGSSTQSIRNNVRLRHTAAEADPKDLGGYLVISKKPSGWMKAAAKAVVKSSELAEQARDFRKKQRDEAAAAKASGIAPVPVVRKTRKDRIGEYFAEWLSFGPDAEGKADVTVLSSDLMDFYTNHFDPKKTLVLSTNSSEYTPANFVDYFKNFSIDPQDAQFLRVSTGAQIDTLRILLGGEDEVQITGLYDWLKENFAKLAKFNGRSPQEIASEIPFIMDRAQADLFTRIGLDSLHPKYGEVVAAKKELEEAQSLFTASRGYYGYGYSNNAGSLVRSLIEGQGSARIQDRPEFFFLSNLGYYYQGELKESDKATIRHSLNQMVEAWLDNLALEEIEAEEAAEEATKAAEAESKSPSLTDSSTAN